MIKTYQSTILDIYENIRKEEEEKLKIRKNIIKEKVPEILQIENKIKKLCINLSINILKNTKNKELYLKKLKSKITELRIKKSELLVSNGYPINYLDLNYKCNKCKDTGFIGTKKCDCYNKYLIDIYYNNSDLKDILVENNFNNFDLELFSDKQIDNKMDSPRKNMKKILRKAKNFIITFSSSKENLLFYGNSGTGKSFLSNCIAKKLLDKGFLVVYKTSDDLLRNLRDIKFDKNYDLEDLIINCDLLIIDDLGTEQMNDFSKAELFNFLNKKLLKNKKMIISTNFTLENILKNYSERISSRLIGNFSLCKFYGEDIRINKNIKNGI